MNQKVQKRLEQLIEQGGVLLSTVIQKPSEILGSIEVFADDGRTVMTDIFFPKKPFNTVSVLANDNDVKIKFGTFTKLKPAGFGE